MDPEAVKLIQQQKRFGSYISNFSTNCTKSKPAAQFTLADVEYRMQLLEEYWKDYTKRDDNLQDFAEALADDNYFKEDDYTTTSNRYLDAKHWLANRRQEIQAASPTAVAHNGPSGQQVVQPRMSLEAIKLPHFTGAQKEWDSFKEKFMSLVVLDTSINVVCKFIRLTNCLSGPALGKLSGITSFNPAWEALCKRYDNHRLRFSTHMKAVIQLPSSKQESTTHLNQLLNTVSEAVTTFTTLNRAVAEWDDILVYLVESKLAPETTKDWAKVIETREVDQFPTYAELKKFLETRVRTLDMIVAGDSYLFHERDSSLCQNSKQRQSQSGSGDSLNHKKSSYAKRTAVYVATQPGSQTGVTKCTLCEGGHLLSHCKEFQALPTTQRKEHVVKARLCYNCLSPKHMTNACTSQNRCYVCNGKHHTRLHLDSKGTPTAVNTCTTSGPMSASTEEPSPSCYTVSASRTILLSTACVTLCSDQGHAIIVRALLDSGSEESFISEHVAQALGVKRKAVNVAVSGVGGETNAVARSRVLVTLKSQHDIEYTRSVSALVLTRLTATLPRQQISMQKWPHLQGLFLADPTFGTPGRIDCILNSAVYAGALRPGLKKGVEGAPVALASVFGWLIMGSAGASDSMTQPQIGMYHICIDHELSEALSRFWEVEEDTREKPLSPEDQWCYDHFKQTHSRNEEGHFVVKLPFKELPQLQDTRATATSCLQRTERRFVHKPDVEASYKTFMEEYRSLGHMELKKNQRDSTDNFSCYLTHHAVFKNDKIQVVFNASLKDRCGKSLNSYLHIGPKLQENIVVIIMRWMFLRYAFTCDIVKMFRQILVHQDDVKWQRILWRDSADLPIDHYSLLTVTYGMASAPFLANACMLRLADDENHRFPLAATVLRKYCYADDFFTGGGTIEEATQVRDELIKMLASAGMEVGKWAANHVNLLNNIDKVAEKQTMIQEGDVVSTLELHWSPAEDAFIFKITPVEPAKTVTKRAILSEIARLFDPIGWLAPIIIRAKILMQNLWLQGIDWDAPVPTTTEHAWQLFKEQLKDIEDIRIPRWLGTTQDSTWQLHCFCDASERAFATVLYLRVTNGNSCHTRLIAAKSRVAPVKVMSLPRLELEGAVLMVHLVSAVTPKLESTPISIHCWSDSQVVLAWLKAHPSRWKTAVANRVSEIISLLPTAIWNHIRSAHNPADLATRGVTPNQLRDSQLWWEGPPWLLQGESAWPSNSEDEVTTLEAKGTASSQVFTAQVEEMSDWLRSFSSLDKIVRILAYIYRWRCNALVAKELRRLTWLNATEIAMGHRFLMQIIQRTAFKDEIERLSQMYTVSRSSSLCRLSPFIDKEGLVRVGGRLQNSFLTASEKHPIILPSRHHVTTLIIQKAHLVTLHGGPTWVQSHLSRYYWILRGRNLIRSIVRRCVRCACYNAHSQEQMMGALPAARTRPARPFTYSGLDYVGPFLIRASPGRGQKVYKGYVAIFVCMVVKAVHLEVVSDLTTAALLAAFRRFTARRGLPKVICSDNATNFHGADTELQKMFNATSAMSQVIAAEVARDNVTCTYIPPRAPNFGGRWEANVKSFKRHLSRIVGESKLTVEEFYTVALQIEAYLNSRPLSPPSANNEGIPALTPGHFLIGTALTAPPEVSTEINEPNTTCSRWRLLTLMRNHFWQRWKSEYLTQMQQRVKWLYPRRNLQVGDIVLFKDELSTPTKWPLARVKHLHPGRDNLVRVVTVEMNGSDYKRAINKLILLPANEAAFTFYNHSRLLTMGGQKPSFKIA